jgi:hypothetical protein
MKKISFVSLAILFVCSAICLPSCIKHTEAPLVAGTWIIDTSRTSIAIYTTPDASFDHPELYEKIKGVISPLRNSLKDPIKLVLGTDSTFRFDYNAGLTTTGHYQQFGNIIAFLSLSFPDGIHGASDGSVFELYYGKNDILPRLSYYLMLDPEEEEILTEMITDAQGFATYFR